MLHVSLHSSNYRKHARRLQISGRRPQRQCDVDCPAACQTLQPLDGCQRTNEPNNQQTRRIAISPGACNNVVIYCTKSSAFMHTITFVHTLMYTYIDTYTIVQKYKVPCTISDIQETGNKINIIYKLNLECKPKGH